MDVQPITHDQAQRLLSLARQSAEAWVREERKTAPPSDLVPPLDERRGLFVTLRVGGELRGCMGAFDPPEPLGQLIPRLTITSLNDPRFVFNQVMADELGDLRIELSVLSPMWLSKDPLAELKPGVHGINVVVGRQAGCFLPQVATELEWDAETFLSECCRGKARVPADAWKDSAAKVYLFTAQIFKEGE